jgi:hypothetical protein
VNALNSTASGPSSIATITGSDHHGIATSAWLAQETDAQRIALLAAADRLLTGTPRRSTGNLSVVQLAIEADVKYWVVAQRHTDLRDHFQNLARAAGNTPAAFRKTIDAHDQLKAELDRLRQHCDGVEQIVGTYATVINELALENHALKEQLSRPSTNVTPLQPRRGTSQGLSN